MNNRYRFEEQTDPINKKKVISIIALSLAVLLVLISLGSIVETNQAGYVKILQVPVTGSLKVYNTPGMFFQTFGSVSEYKLSGTYRFGQNEEDNSDVERSLVSTPVQVQFSDAGIAGVAGTARFDLPASDEAVLLIHKKFRSYEHLAENLIKPTINEALILTASLMTAEESYSGRRAEFAQLAQDQVLNGVYLTEWRSVDKVDPVTGEKVTHRVVQVKRDKDGKPVRKPNPLQDYGISISQLVLDRTFEYEEGVLEQIKTQRDAMMKTVTARAEAQKAEQDAITIEAKGKASVMQAKYTAEVEKESAVVSAQREKEVAELAAQRQLEVAKLEKEAAEQTKQKDILLGQGEAERKRLVLAADGALAQKLAAYERVQATWAKAFAERKVPTMVMGAGESGTDSDVKDFMSLMTAKAAKDMSLSLETR